MIVFQLWQAGIGKEFGQIGFLALVAAYAFALIFAIVPHEAAHGLAALKCGDPSAKLAGRISLNPARHFDAFGFLCFVIVGVGWAKPVPVNPFNYRNFRRGNFWVSTAGVFTNLVIAFVTSAFMFFLYKADLSNVGLFFLYYACFLSMTLNVSLAVFNMLPIYPLDGFNMLASFTKPNNAYMDFMRRNGQWTMFLIMAVVLFTDVIGTLSGAIRNLFTWFWGVAFWWL